MNEDHILGGIVEGLREGLKGAGARITQAQTGNTSSPCVNVRFEIPDETKVAPWEPQPKAMLEVVVDKGSYHYLVHCETPKRALDLNDPGSLDELVSICQKIAALAARR